MVCDGEPAGGLKHWQVELRIAPDKDGTQFLFGAINDEATRPGLALVRLRHAEGGPAEQHRRDQPADEAARRNVSLSKCSSNQ